MTVTIYHNPGCGTSRNTLAMIRNAGIEPHVIEYLATPPTKAELLGLVSRMGLPLRAVLRRKGTPFDELGLDAPSLTDADLLDAIARYPILLNRPIVVTPGGVRLCRPSELVLDLLDRPQLSRFSKEDGEPVVIATPLAADGREALAATLTAEGLPTSDLETSGAHFHRFTTTIGEPVGFGGLDGSGEDRLLRSVVIMSAHRGKGLGRAIVGTLDRFAGQAGAKRLHLLTETAAPFFERMGFNASDRQAAPPSIAATAEFTSLCRKNARYLVKDVKSNW